MNVKTSIKDNLLTIIVDVSEATLKAAQPSQSGKTRLVASTHGFIKLDKDIGVSLNVTGPAAPAAPAAA